MLWGASRKPRNRPRSVLPVERNVLTGPRRHFSWLYHAAVMWPWRLVGETRQIQKSESRDVSQSEQLWCSIFDHLCRMFLTNDDIGDTGLENPWLPGDQTRDHGRQDDSIWSSRSWVQDHSLSSTQQSCVLFLLEILFEGLLNSEGKHQKTKNLWSIIWKLWEGVWNMSVWGETVGLPWDNLKEEQWTFEGRRRHWSCSLMRLKLLLYLTDATGAHRLHFDQVVPVILNGEIQSLSSN